MSATIADLLKTTLDGQDKFKKWSEYKPELTVESISSTVMLVVDTLLFFDDVVNLGSNELKRKYGFASDSEALGRLKALSFSETFISTIESGRKFITQYFSEKDNPHFYETFSKRATYLLLGFINNSVDLITSLPSLENVPVLKGISIVNSFLGMFISQKAEEYELSFNHTEEKLTQLFITQGLQPGAEVASIISSTNSEKYVGENGNIAEPFLSFEGIQNSVSRN